MKTLYVLVILALAFMAFLYVTILATPQISALNQIP